MLVLCYFFNASWNLGTHERLEVREDTTRLQLQKQGPKPQSRVWAPLLWMRFGRPRGQRGVESGGV